MIKPTKRFGVRDLAKLANVSLGTVDRALNQRGEIKEATRQRILAIARENGYVPNLTARALSFSRSSLKIGLCMPRELHYFFDQVHAGFMDEVHRYSHIGVDVLYRPIEKLNSPAPKTVKALLDSNIDALVLLLESTKKVASLIEEAETKKNVRVVCVMSDDFPSRRSTSICVDPDLSGSMAAEMMAMVVPPGSEVAAVTGMLAVSDHGRKIAGFQRSFPVECPSGKVVKVIEGHEEEREIFEKTLHLLSEHKQLAGIYVSTAHSVPVCRAVESKGLARKVKIISTDLFAELMTYFNNGTLCASIYQNPHLQGQTAVRLLLDHFLDGKEFPATHYIDPVIALRTNLKLFREMQPSSGVSPQFDQKDDKMKASRSSKKP